MAKFMISDSQKALDGDLDDRDSWVYREESYESNIRYAKRALIESGYKLDKIEQEIKEEKEDEDIMENGVYDILYTVNEIMANEMCAPCRVAREIINLILSGDYDKAGKIAETALEQVENGDDLENFDVDKVAGETNEET